MALWRPEPKEASARRLLEAGFESQSVGAHQPEPALGYQARSIRRGSRGQVRPPNEGLFRLHSHVRRGKLQERPP